jgi:hypothetical protein
MTVNHQFHYQEPLPYNDGKPILDGCVDKEHAQTFERESRLLLTMFDEAHSMEDHQRRGYLLQDLLNRVFTLHGIQVIRSFTRNNNAEQIDGAFTIDAFHYIVECRWRSKVSDIRELDGLSGQVGRSGKQTMGVFLSINGWSEHVVPLLKQNPEKNIILMEGFDFRSVLDLQADLRKLIQAKLAKLNIECEPFLSVREFLS